eukprot:TRINITY_DN10169_c0_g1_i3.p1 TRINITY_DN10169_c0_g1~~TRINITY_DN10169_c0_g1_i3.p1  ORF type:complete len:138 (+),score=21.97 TRINITY_DN10169_c0_g1_i3:275-688(+)
MIKLVALAKSDIPEVHYECMWCLRNVLSGCTQEQLEILLELEIVEVFCKALLDNLAQVLIIGLEGFNKMLGSVHAEYVDKIVLRIEKCNGLKTLENLLTHPNAIIYSKALKLIEEYFGVDNQCNDNEITKPISIFDF